MGLSEHLKKIRDGLREGRFNSEAAVSQGILLPTLYELGWPIFDTSIVIPEYTVEGRRVDYALCHPRNKPYVFIEVKKIGLSDGADKQLFEYAFHLGVPIAILTDGQEWSFYLPGEQGRYDERRVYKLDILERDIEEAERRLQSYLSYQHVCSGKALESARSDYKNVSRIRTIESTLPKAWEALLKDHDSLLLDLLAEKVEDLCGYKPDLDLCGQFINNQIQSGANIIQPEFTKKPSKPKEPTYKASNRKGKFSIIYRGKEIEARSARDVMIKIFEILYKEDSSFLERFASRKHGKKRRYLSRDKYELYPGRPDLADEHSVEIVSGWWLGTNYSRKNIQDIINLALEVAGAQKSIRVNVL
ncbi:predicted type IV restriction endonuclease [Nitratiruptor sp. YY08-26]|uniref:type I restriction enzyme HsdR N-terminal domain-containing protein n=1 Tax=unclassified Nitratiruptor TaxID=2624044 RepID=UPI001916A2F1|nr:MULTISPECIES: type I restriction enzyme HsdR N-terminal domain-containing protein [unclassified Nitratiruptor]BCD61516.1 predicted type IV restriction endonuclease [Nitratiruptor sp. YY08-13]BCD65450.1 predicted type IV restriction endonuclease [Nitratiruptor sp. YY08-26]